VRHAHDARDDGGQHHLWAHVWPVARRGRVQHEIDGRREQHTGELRGHVVEPMGRSVGVLWSARPVHHVLRAVEVDATADAIHACACVH
jgi:hypothetical protein